MAPTSGNTGFIAKDYLIANCSLKRSSASLPSMIHNVQLFKVWKNVFKVRTFFITLQMFCLQNTQMFVCILNSRTNMGCFYTYLSAMDNKYFHVVFTLNQTLNSLKNKHILSNLQKFFCCFNKLFSY